jgi:hypothetical protein
MDARLHSIEPADQDTCGWAFEIAKFQNWASRIDVASRNGVLWIKGDPGPGKPTLTKQIWLRLRDSYEDSLLVTFSFYSRSKNLLEKSPSIMLGSVLY